MSIINKVLRVVNRKINEFIASIVSVVLRNLLKMKGIKLGENVRFLGWGSFRIGDNASFSIGKDCLFLSNSYFNRIGVNHRVYITVQNGAELKIGKNTGMSGGSITCFKKIVIGDNVKIGANCIIMDGDFHFEDYRTMPPKEIEIQDNVWLGANCIVMKGVTIGENSVIGAGSIVTRDIPRNSIAVGIPCKVVKQL